VLDQHEPDSFGGAAEAFHQTVDAIAGQPEDCIDTPIRQAAYDVFRGNSSHKAVLSW
jgi:hypothetical protein